MKRKYPFAAAVLFAACCLLSNLRITAQSMKMDSGDSYYLFIGTYSPADSNGIFVYRVDRATGHAAFVSAVSGIENPSFLTLSPDHRFLYAVSETHGGQGGHVYAYSFDAATGSLHYLNRQLSGGDDPCNIITDRSGKWLFVANYSSGSLSVLPVEKDGSAGAAVQTIHHHGRGIKPQQESAHVHCIVQAPGGQDFFVTDLGMDKVFTYRLDERTGTLSAGYPPYTSVLPGSGPRILDFSPDGRHLYLIHELGGEITVFDRQPGKLHIIQTLSNLPEDYHGRIWAADIHLSPDGRFLYASDRDDLNDIVVYSVDPVTGKLAFLSRTSAEGKTPRNFALTPDGAFVLAGHQHGEDITVFKRDAHTGALAFTGERIPIAHAVCLKLIPAK
jgi:6-phosphogluconolactonase